MVSRFDYDGPLKELECLGEADALLISTYHGWPKRIYDYLPSV